MSVFKHLTDNEYFKCTDTDLPNKGPRDLFKKQTKKKKTQAPDKILTRDIQTLRNAGMQVPIVLCIYYFSI